MNCTTFLLLIGMAINSKWKNWQRLDSCPKFARKLCVLETVANIVMLETKASECKLGLFQDADSAGYSADPKILVRSSIVRLGKRNLRMVGVPALIELLGHSHRCVRAISLATPEAMSKIMQTQETNWTQWLIWRFHTFPACEHLFLFAKTTKW